MDRWVPAQEYAARGVLRDGEDGFAAYVEYSYKEKMYLHCICARVIREGIQQREGGLSCEMCREGARYWGVVEGE